MNIGYVILISEALLLYNNLSIIFIYHNIINFIKYLLKRVNNHLKIKLLILLNIY